MAKWAQICGETFDDNVVVAKYHINISDIQTAGNMTNKFSFSSAFAFSMIGYMYPMLYAGCISKRKGTVTNTAVKQSNQ
jgi:hypothetical protein